MTLSSVEESYGAQKDQGKEEDQEAVYQMQLQGEECGHCFQLTCITQRGFSWVGNGQPSCDENSAIRRAKFSHYWKVISNLGGWNDPRYLHVKLERANGGE